MDRIELLRKVKALAELGVGGEQVNAETLLKKLMHQYGISESELIENESQTRQLKRPKEFEWLFDQIRVSVVGRKRPSYRYVDKKMDRNFEVVVCSAIEAIEIQQKFDFYLSRFKSDFQDFKAAFVFRNNLVPIEGPSEKVPTQEEIEDYLRRQKMANAMQQHDFFKQLPE